MTSATEVNHDTDMTVIHGIESSTDARDGMHALSQSPTQNGPNVTFVLAAQFPPLLSGRRLPQLQLVADTTACRAGK